MLTFALAACSGNAAVTLEPGHSVPATPTATPPAVTVALVAGSPIAVPPVGGFNASITYTTAAGTPFPSVATVTVRSYVGEPAGGPSPQGRRVHRFDSAAEAVVSFTATFGTSVTLVNGSLALEDPNADPATTYGAETFDESTGRLVAYSHPVPVPCPTSAGCSTSFLQFVDDTPPYTVTPGVSYVTIVVANPAVTSSPAPAPLASCQAATPAPPSPTAGASSAPYTATVCDGSIALPPIGSFGGTLGYSTGFVSLPAGLTVTLQSFLGEPPGGAQPLVRRDEKRRFDAQPGIVASFRSTFSADAMLTDSFVLNLPDATPATYTAETFDVASGQLLSFVRGAPDPSGGSGYSFAISLPAYTVTGGSPVDTLIVANSAVSPAP